MAAETFRDRLGRPDRRDLLGALGAVVLVNLIGASPAFLFGADTGWIDRPWFFPPEWAFGVAWTLLFTLMGIALWLVARRGLDRRPVQLAVGLFAAQMLVNVAWTPAFFGLRSPAAGLVVILALWVLIVATIWAFDRVDRIAAGLLIPYLAWVSFAAVLNAEIWRLMG